MVIFAIFTLGIIAGIFGRMGGAGHPYKSWMRDWLVPLFFLTGFYVLYPLAISIKLMAIFIITYGLLGASLTTYWDEIFGWDNLGFAGFVCGLSAIPLVWLKIKWYWIVIRALFLGMVWFALNKYLPPSEKKIFGIWRRDVAEEFLRYFWVVMSLFLLIL